MIICLIKSCLLVQYTLSLYIYRITLCHLNFLLSFIVFNHPSWEMFHLGASLELVKTLVQNHISMYIFDDMIEALIPLSL